MRAAYVTAAICAAALAFGAAGGAEAKSACVKKAGEGWGMSKGMAQFQSFEIIQQVTGNWPVQTDLISKPSYSCKGSGGGWTCIARATVCKKGA
ncbi:hypothetical protein [Rhodomicrobium sp. R_RK_3]|nr:hypothetical protein [Rhodomicrobium sp. R_RK_3]